MEETDKEMLEKLLVEYNLEEIDGKIVSRSGSMESNIFAFFNKCKQLGIKLD